MGQLHIGVVEVGCDGDNLVRFVVIVHVDKGINCVTAETIVTSARKRTRQDRGGQGQRARAFGELLAC